MAPTRHETITRPLLSWRPFVELLTGTAAEVIARIAACFTPDRAKFEAAMQAIAKEAVLFYLVSSAGGQG